DLDVRSDIYSFGGGAYFLLTSQPPFVRETVMELLIAHASEEGVPPRSLRPDIPGDLEAIVLRCLGKDCGKSVGNDAEVEGALMGCASAGEWKEEAAAEWWRNHGETVSIPSPESEAVENQSTMATSA